MQGWDPSADSAAGMAGGGASIPRSDSFWRESGKSNGAGEHRTRSKVFRNGALSRVRRRAPRYSRGAADSHLGWVLIQITARQSLPTGFACRVFNRLAIISCLPRGPSRDF
jgi:hypothetical protein